MDDKISALESADGGHHSGHLHNEQQRVDGESEVESTSGRDTVEVTGTTARSATPKEAHDLALRENITIAEAYSRLLGVECGINKTDEE